MGVEGYAFAHGAAGAVGKGEAEHVGILHAVGVGMDDPLRQYEGFAAARRRKYQMTTPVKVYDFLLIGVGFHVLKLWVETAKGGGTEDPVLFYSTVTLLARLRGWSTLRPLAIAT